MPEYLACLNANDLPKSVRWVIVCCCRQREEMLCQLKVTLSPSVPEKSTDSLWILVDSDGEEVTC